MANKRKNSDTTSYKREWYQRNKERVQQKRKEWLANNREYLLLKQRRANVARYGITVEQFDEMTKAQSGVCAICQNPQTGSRWTNLSIDHDHETNRVRGLLCAECNLGLGKFKDNPELLEAAARYLKDHKS